MAPDPKEPLRRVPDPQDADRNESDPRALHEARAKSFGAAASIYERARPGYPEAAIDWLLGEDAKRVVEIGAGTGKLTRQLASRDIELVAIEPDDQMRATLNSVSPEIDARAGTAEQLPLADHSADIVIGAQMWHWVDPEPAAQEVARVLTSDGHLALIWNTRDERVDWVAQLSAIIGEHQDLDPSQPLLEKPFTRLEYFETEWSQAMTRESLHELVASRSYMIVADETRRKRTFAALDELLDTHPQLAGHEHFELPYVTQCTRAWRDTPLV